MTRRFVQYELVEVIPVGSRHLDPRDWRSGEYLGPGEQGWHRVKLTALGTFGQVVHVPDRRIRLAPVRADECETCLGAGRIRDGDTNELRRCLDCGGNGKCR